MPIDKRVHSAAEALADVADGATVLISGFGGAGFPNVLIRALTCLPQAHLVIAGAGAKDDAFHELAVTLRIER